MASSSSTIFLGSPSVASDTSLVSDDDSNLISKTASLNLGEEESSPMMGLTENGSATFLSSGNPCLDFFFHIVPYTPPHDLIQRLALSWSHDPLTTLKLVCNLRGVRGTGKSDKEGFYTAAYWLFQNHPKTLALNLPALVDFGYFKDLPEILYRILEGQQMERGKKREWRTRGTKRKIEETKPFLSKVKAKALRKQKAREVRKQRDLEKAKRALEGSEVRSVPDGKVEARALRKQRELEKAKRALERYNSDASYRLLFDKVADLFGELLKSDLESLKSNELNKIGLAAKWCPSLDSSYDKTTLICEAIARRVFPREQYQDVDEVQYVYRIRNRLRKEVLVPLRKALELPEVAMSAKKWDSVKYDRVASVAMKNYRDVFRERDGERFEEYLKEVSAGRAKIAAGALLPHEIIDHLKFDDDDVMELQWARMVDDLTKKGKMKSSLAICDVSGSMEGGPMDVCVALGLLVSEINEEPWKGKVITFSENPQLHVVTGSSLKEKTEFVKNMEWGYGTNFQKVFDRILEVAVENNITNDQMIKRLFVFSDMDFDIAMECSDSEDDVEDDEIEIEGEYEEVKEEWRQWAKEKWETDYEVIKRKYKESGYDNVPEMVFWNLRHSSSTPVLAKEKGVALVSGVSKNLLTLFLEEGEIVTPVDEGESGNPEDVMLLATRGDEYNKLVVYD